MIIRVINCGDKPWRWPFTEDGVADVVQPGETYDIDLTPKGRQPGETTAEFRARVDRECDEIEATGPIDPRYKLMDALYKAGQLVAVPPAPETMH